MNVSTPRLTLLSTALIAILLVILGILQYRWVGELSEFEGERMRRSLQTASERFQDDFERDLDNVFEPFSIDRGDGDEVPDVIIGAYAEWAALSRFPELVAQVFWVSAETEPEISRLNLAEGHFEATAWPSELEELRDEFHRDVRRRPHGERRRGSYFTSIGDVLALVVTQRYRPTQNRAIVLMDRGVLVERVIPERIQQYVAGGSELDYDVWILDETNGGRLVYSSAPLADAGDLSRPDVQVNLEIPDHLDLEIPDHLDRRPEDDDEGHILSVLLRHRAGSLEAAIEQIRRRNLMVSLGTLVLLGATVLVLTAATRRAQSLAAQQMEFVAGVSHELRTPITGISSLSQNLADGVVGEPEQAKTYGTVIHRESRRLADMIERVLQFSVLRSGKRGQEPRPVRVPDLVADALDAIGPALPNQFRFEQAIDRALPYVLGDAHGLTSAIQNLISNAMKFTETGGVIRLTVRDIRVRDRREVQLAVEDHGPGIPSSEQSHVFEPFYRGKAARADQVEGSGLGLSLVKDIVETHGGRVTLVSSPGRGSTFTLHLPVAEAGTRSGDGHDG